MLWPLQFTTLTDMSYITSCYDPCYLLLYQICPILPHAITLAIYYLTRYVLYYPMLWPLLFTTLLDVTYNTPCYDPCHLLLYQICPILPHVMTLAIYYFTRCVLYYLMLWPLLFTTWPNMSYITPCYDHFYLLLYQICPILPHAITLAIYYLTRYVLYYPMLWPLLFTTLLDVTYNTSCYDPCYLLLDQICPILPHAMTLAIYYLTRYVLYYLML